MKVKNVIINSSIMVIALLLGIFGGNIVSTIRTKTDKTFLNKINGTIRISADEFATKKELNKDYFFILFGAEWCPYCKESKEEITNFYNEYSKKYNNFAFIVAGAMQDTSNEDLITYITSEEYPFYFVDYDQRDLAGFFQLPEYTSCEKFYIPALMLIDRHGKVLSNSNALNPDDYDEYRPFELYKELMSK